MEIKEDVTVKEYFEEFAPEMFDERVSGTNLSGMEGTEFRVQFDIMGDEKQTYGLVIKDAKELEVVSGPLPDPIITIELSENTWRESVTGKLEGVVENLAGLGEEASRARYDQVKAMKGTLNLELARQDMPGVQLKVVFNGAEKPSTTFKASLENWVKISKGELAGPAAFMSGSLKIEGDMPFAMALGNLTS